MFICILFYFNRDIPFKELDEYLSKYQDPKSADAMTKIQSELDETKIILVGIVEFVCLATGLI